MRWTPMHHIKNDVENIFLYGKVQAKKIGMHRGLLFKLVWIYICIRVYIEKHCHWDQWGHGEFIFFNLLNCIFNEQILQSSDKRYKNV